MKLLDGQALEVNYIQKMSFDYDEMEALGIYEVAEEDFALCEFVDVSKMEVQSIIRKGIDLMRLS